MAKASTKQRVNEAVGIERMFRDLQALPMFNCKTIRECAKMMLDMMNLNIRNNLTNTLQFNAMMTMMLLKLSSFIKGVKRVPVFLRDRVPRATGNVAQSAQLITNLLQTDIIGATDDQLNTKHYAAKAISAALVKVSMSTRELLIRSANVRIAMGDEAQEDLVHMEQNLGAIVRASNKYSLFGRLSNFVRVFGEQVYADPIFFMRIVIMALSFLAAIMVGIHVVVSGAALATQAIASAGATVSAAVNEFGVFGALQAGASSALSSSASAIYSGVSGTVTAVIWGPRAIFDTAKSAYEHMQTLGVVESMAALSERFKAFRYDYEPGVREIAAYQMIMGRLLTSRDFYAVIKTLWDRAGYMSFERALEQEFEKTK